jgi:hypothetical protein
MQRGEINILRRIVYLRVVGLICKNSFVLCLRMKVCYWKRRHIHQVMTIISARKRFLDHLPVKQTYGFEKLFHLTRWKECNSQPYNLRYLILLTLINIGLCVRSDVLKAEYLFIYLIIYLTTLSIYKFI